MKYGRHIVQQLNTTEQDSSHYISLKVHKQSHNFTAALQQERSMHCITINITYPARDTTHDTVIKQ